jgi:hypothetical protein
MAKWLSKLTKSHSSRAAVADLLERFLNLGTTAWEWDDFVSVPQSDPLLEEIRTACLKVRQDYPAGAIGAWCSSEGIEEMRKITVRLRSSV